MNEVTRIHLGRQPFTISVDAHRVLKEYLAAIKKQVGDDDVMQEVELRMAELLSERGITGDKVVLPEDVAFLKQQLGDPAEFSDDGETEVEQHAEEQSAKRLFRDTDSALLAGVASGIAAYFGLDAVLVRLIFIVLTIFGGGIGIVLYLLLWLAVPPATTASEKLQMRGKSVTLEALKESVSKADIPSAARRGSNSLLVVINKLLAVGIKILGVGFIVAGLLAIFGLVATKIYMSLHGGQLFQENLFPIGFREDWLVVLGMILAAIIALFLMLVGVAALKRKWPIRGWVTAVLAGVFLVGLAATSALAADIGPRIEERYHESMHTTAVKNIQPFNQVKTYGELDVSYISSPSYSVNLHYFGSPDLSKIKVSVKDNVLIVDSSKFDGRAHCHMLCLFPEYNMTVQIAAPNVKNFDVPEGDEIFYSPTPSATLRVD
jgi:phage shock protein PspC (stress-responsive transcriptional regulator)